MKKHVLTFLSLILLSSGFVQAVEPMAAAAAERFYGKITSIDPSQKSLTVRNKKKNMDSRFQWTDQTTFTNDRKSIAPSELKVGESLIVSYVTENDLNKAKKITVKHPFKKRQQ
jgi:hypothetical protein